MVPGGGTVPGAGGGGRGAGPPGGPAFVRGAAGRRWLLSAPPGRGRAGRRSERATGGAGSGWRGGSGRTRASARDRCLGRGGGQGLPEQTLCAGGRPNLERAARLGLPQIHRAPALGAAQELRSFNASRVCRGSARGERAGGLPCPRAEAEGGFLPAPAWGKARGQPALLLRGAGSPNRRGN